MRNYAPSFRNTGPYTSPGTPEYGLNSADDIPKTWSSERVPPVTGSGIGSRRHTSTLIPFTSGWAPPSKWDDAERWITSPISGHGGFFRSPVAQAHYRRPKSKSGPLGPAGPGPHEGRVVARFAMANLPLTTGVLAPDQFLAVGSRDGPGLSDMASEGCLSFQGIRLDGAKEDEARFSCRDMATQMSPQGSSHSSSMGRLSFSNLSCPFPTSDNVHENTSAKDEIRDVQVDKGTSTIIRHPKKKRHEKKDKGSSNVEDLNSWNIPESSKNISKFQREETKITAWENLQKAKAEAAIRKLEMKLEKKREAAMNKIMKKLKAAQTKAQALRGLLSNKAPPTSQRGFCIYVKICSTCSCFLCTKP